VQEKAVDAEYSIARVIRELGSRNPEPAWAEFLRVHAALIFQVVRLFEREQDEISDCFLFVCEQLSRGRFRRLRKFRPKGPAKFETWLRAVVRNLCLDWHRKEFGRHRVFHSISRLSDLEQEVFRCVYEGLFSPEYALTWLAPRFPQLTRSTLDECIERIEGTMTSRQRWLLSVRNRRALAQESANSEDSPAARVADAAANPETEASLQERKSALLGALKKLTARERLMIRLRFEDDLTLEQVAKIFHLADAQTADRRLRELLGRLRGFME